MPLTGSASQLAVRTAKAALTRARVFSWGLRPHETERGLRIFLYHRISDDPDPLALSPAKFRKQMEYLAASGYRAVDAVSALDRLFTGQLEPDTVAITFDDGFKDILDNAYRVLVEFGFSATVFVATDVVDGKAQYDWAPRQAPMLTWKEIRRLDAAGILRFEPHSMTHPDLRHLDDDDTRSEIDGSKHDLEKQLGREAYAFCYPGGFVGLREHDMVRAAGFRYAVTCEPGLNTASTDPYFVHRVQVEQTDSVREFRAKVGGSHDRPLIGRDRYRRLRYGTST